MSTNVERFARRLKKEEDDVWDRYLRILERAQRTTKAVELMKELELLHSSRTSRQLTTKTGGVTAQHLIDSNLQDIAYRSRMVEMKVTISKQSRLLEAALGAVDGHILSNYPDEIVEIVGKLKANQQNFVDSLLRDGWEELEKMNRVASIAEELIEDLDKTQWAMKNLVALLTIVTQRESIVKVSEV